MSAERGLSFAARPSRRDVSVGQRFERLTPFEQAYVLAGVAGTALGAYHGYRRNDSVGWAIVWGLLGGMFPVVTIPVALAQGFGRPAR